MPPPASNILQSSRTLLCAAVRPSTKPHLLPAAVTSIYTRTKTDVQRPSSPLPPRKEVALPSEDKTANLASYALYVFLLPPSIQTT